jgi:hypothetical protein
MKGYVRSRKIRCISYPHSYDFNSEDEYINKLQNYFEYLNKLNIVNINLTKASYFTLYQFIKFAYLSTNDIYNLLIDTVYEADYKNILKKIKNLYKLGLIERVRPNKLPEYRNMIYYKLSSAGIIYVFYKLTYTDYEEIKINKFIEYHREDKFFNIFLSPYFEIDSLINITSKHITTILFEYCIEICKQIIKEVEIFNKMENRGGGPEVPYLYWSNFLKYNPDDTDSPNYRNIEEFLFDIKKQDDLYWLDEENIEVNIVDNLTVTFSLNEHKLIIKIDEKNKKALVFYNEEELGYYSIKREYNDFLFYAIQYRDTNEVMSHVRIHFKSEIENIVAKLGFRILESTWWKYNYPWYDKKVQKKVEQDLVLLANDSKILDLVEDIRFNFNRYYKKFYENKDKNKNV